MKKFTLVHEIQCTPERFWEVFFDKEFNRSLYVEGLKFSDFTVVEQTAGPDVRRKVKGTPKVELPGAIAKLVGDKFGYEEEGTFNAAKKEWRWKMRPSVMADKMRMEGVLRVEAAGAGKCRRIAEMEVEAKVFGIGGMVESTSEKEMRAGWDGSAAYMNKWLREHAG
ncbi:MAG TPA: DUF2505 domain-containing protein [Nannocystaceae bacterium]|nr:DUF2505 domain-containing protein [Nannocystaceae bacterium]